MFSLPTDVYFAICLASVLSVAPLACLATDVPTMPTGLATSVAVADDMGEMSRDGKAPASSLVHMHFLYMQCLGNMGKRCANSTQYNCAKIVRSHSADTVFTEGKQTSHLRNTSFFLFSLVLKLTGHFQRLSFCIFSTPDYFLEKIFRPC